MTSDLILVERQYEGERCELACVTRWIDGRTGVCNLHGQTIQHGAPEMFHYIRCPRCLATPSARVLTPEMVEAVEGLLSCMALAGWEDDPNAVRARAAFGLEVGR